MARPAFQTASQSFPRQGNKELPIILPFTALVTSITDDLSPEMQASEIESIQSVYIDNGANPLPLTLQFTPSFQKITVPAFTQGIFPVIVWGRATYTASTDGGATVTLIFSNTRKSFYSWRTQ